MLPLVILTMDGDMDMLCAGSTEDRLTIFYNDGSGSFSENELDEFVNYVQEVADLVRG